MVDYIPAIVIFLFIGYLFYRVYIKGDDIDFKDYFDNDFFDGDGDFD